MSAIAEGFTEHARHSTGAPALVWDATPITYAELQRMVAEAGDALAALGLPEDRPVGIQAKKSPRAIALILACLTARRPFLLPSIELAADTLDKLFAQAHPTLVPTPPEQPGGG